MKKHFAVILSGCGGMDGSETHEAVSLMIAIKKNHCDYSCFALNDKQKYVINTTPYGIKQISTERNILEESGRLNHGHVNELKKMDISKFDGLIFPGGYGTATSYSNFIKCNGKLCEKNLNYSVIKEIKDIICEFHNQQKPIFTGCAATNLINACFTNIKLAVDEKFWLKEIIEKANNTYEICKAGEICTDKNNKIISAPFYLAKGANVLTIFEESDKAIIEMKELCN